MILQTDEAAWAAARLGCLTASRIADAMAKARSGNGPSASRANYIAELVAERLTGNQGERYVSVPMQWGIDTEAHARSAYEFFTDTSMAPAAFVLHPEIEMAGASTDGFIGDDGLWECKCPNTNTHIDTLLSDSIPSKYIVQMNWQMACTGRRWVDFTSFDPRLPENMRLFVKRLERDDVAIRALENEALLFLNEVAATVSALQRRCAA